MNRNHPSPGWKHHLPDGAGETLTAQKRGVTTLLLFRHCHMAASWASKSCLDAGSPISEPRFAKSNSMSPSQRFPKHSSPPS
ncbi:hypothetical protein AVEN_98043-1 [Araneus ventricosus]|uniref:Uncharacterized protein n=1 Tax=Araneus ventricosus TaxID=182803 RepID=A0A4Y2G6Q6_ARAVE|nr:hypothetical protein AVEN_98043-1 [Araneus ventricosus]